MDWLTILGIGGMLVTVLLVILLIRELRKSMKESNEGKVSGKCELD